MEGRPIEGGAEVDEFMSALEHPLRVEIQALRAIFLAADPRIKEGIKWKSPSFFYQDWFATFNLRSTKEIQIILHTGAKVKASSAEGVPIDDPQNLLQWLAKDRCMLKLSGMEDIASKQQPVTSIIRKWLNQM